MSGSQIFDCPVKKFFFDGIKFASFETVLSGCNHSARKTVVKKLQRQGVQRSDIITVTGHASEKGLDSYDEGDEQQQRVISHIIDGIADQGTTQSLTTSSNETQKENNEVALQTGFHPRFQKVVQRSPLSRCSFNTPSNGFICK